MPRLKSVAFAILLFMGGIALDRLWLEQFDVHPKPAKKSTAGRRGSSALTNRDLHRQLTRDSLKISSSAITLNTTLPNSINQSKGLPPVVPTDDIHRPKNDDLDSANDHESHLYELIHLKLTTGNSAEKSANSDGSTDTREVTDEGSVVLRSFDSEGQLTAEKLQHSSGEEVDRTYYRDGALKAFAWRAPDGVTTLMTFTQSGLSKARVDQHQDGTKISTEYDDQGLVLERWHIGKDGLGARVGSASN